MTIKTRKFLAVMAAVVMALSLLALAACDGMHQHTFSEQWQKDETSHWHAATCEHSELVSDKAAHDFDANGKCTVCDYQQGTTPGGSTDTPGTGGSTDTPGTGGGTGGTTPGGDTPGTGSGTGGTTPGTGGGTGTDTPGTGGGTTPGGSTDTPGTHTHTYTQGWWSDETNHWHAATCEHSELKSDEAAHVYNKYGRCTVCNYQGEVPCDTSLTAEQYAAAMRDAANAPSFTIFMKENGETEQETYVDDDVILIKDLVDNVITHGKLNSSFQMTAAFYEDGMIETSSTCRELGETKNNFKSIVDELSEIPFNLLKAAGSDHYELEFQGVKVQLAFVDGELYSVDAGEIVLTDIGNTHVESLFEHVHDQADGYATSSMYHWHPVLCQDHPDEIVEKQPHTFGTGNTCTVCGYQKPAEVNRQVTEEQWREAFKIKGIVNCTINFNGNYSHDGIEAAYITAEGIYTGNSEGTGYEYVQILERGKVCNYYYDYSGKRVKAEGSEADYWTDVIERYLLVREYCTVGELFDQFQYDEATGRYVGSAKLWDRYRSGEAYVTFNNGELECVDFEQKELYTLTFGDAHIDFPDLPMHEHTTKLYSREEDEHVYVCTQCGELVYAPHTFENGACSVCGIKFTDKNHDHNKTDVTYVKMCRDPGNDEWTRYHQVVCKECGAYIFSAPHELENGVCTLCGEEQHRHSFVPDATRSDEMYHTVTCSDPDCGYIELYKLHTYKDDPTKCDVCGQARHWHECDSWEKNEIEHRGKCKLCGYTVDEPHIYVNGVCRVCGAKNHNHTWGNYTQLDKENTYYWSDHMVECEDCGVTRYESHAFITSDVCACGFRKHIHTVTDEWELTTYYHSGYCSVCQRDVTGSHSYVNGVCEVCGVKDHNHTWVSPTQFAEDNYEYWIYHTVTCSDCGATTTQDHDYGEGDVCACGLHKHIHTSEYWTRTVTSHQGHCEICQQPVNEEHTYVGGICTVCGAKNHNHTWGTPTQFSKDNYEYWEYHTVTCTDCGVIDERQHQFGEGNICDCGFRKHIHTVTDEWELTAEYHSGYCPVCGKNVYEDHIYVGEVCEVCGVRDHEHMWGSPTQLKLDSKNRYWEYHQLACSCGATTTQPHDYGEDDECACGLHKHVHTGDDWERTDGYHTGICSSCGRQINEEHTYVEGTCTVCGAKDHEHIWGQFSQYVTDADAYWQYHRAVCTDCGVIDMLEHTFENGDVCVCGFHKHEHTVQWVGGVDEHSGECSVCHQRVAEPHTYVEGTCTACGVQEHDHTWGTPTQLDDPREWMYWHGHQIVCTECGATTTQDHDFGEGDVCACGFRKHEHTANWEIHPDSHSGYCSGCDQYVSEPHDYDENYDCRVCGYHHEHTYYYQDNGDEAQHTVRCSDWSCDYEMLEDHTYEDGDFCKCGHPKGE